MLRETPSGVDDAATAISDPKAIADADPHEVVTVLQPPRSHGAEDTLSSFSIVTIADPIVPIPEIVPSAPSTSNTALPRAETPATIVTRAETPSTIVATRFRDDEKTAVGEEETGSIAAQFGASPTFSSDPALPAIGVERPVESPTPRERIQQLLAMVTSSPKRIAIAVGGLLVFVIVLGFALGSGGKKTAPRAAKQPERAKPSSESTVRKTAPIATPPDDESIEIDPTPTEPITKPAPGTKTKSAAAKTTTTTKAPPKRVATKPVPVTKPAVTKPAATKTPTTKPATVTKTAPTTKPTTTTKPAVTKTTIGTTKPTTAKPTTAATTKTTTGTTKPVPGTKPTTTKPAAKPAPGTKPAAKPETKTTKPGVQKPSAKGWDPNQLFPKKKT
jgi:hypothetical protein